MDFVLVAPKSGALAKGRAATPSSVPVTAASPARTAAPVAPRPATTAAPNVFPTATAARSTGLTGVDRRWVPRANLAKRGLIGTASRDEPIECTIRNTSKHGALIELPHPVTTSSGTDRLPDTFTLVWLTNRIRSEVNCTVRWRSHNLVGVNFVGPIATTVDRRA